MAAAAGPRRVVVTGMGLVTPLGVGLRENWRRLLEGASGVRAVEAADLPQGEQGLGSLPSRVVGRVPAAQLDAVDWKVDFDRRRTSPFMAYALVAAEEALRQARWRPEDEAGRQETGVSIGAGMSCTSEFTDAALLLGEGRLRRLSPFFIPKVLVNMPAGLVSIRHGFQGPNHAASTACASGAHAIGDAFRMVKYGDANVMVAGGAEACIDAVTMAGFCRLKALSTRFNDAPAAASRPFDARRDGFVLGEGAGILVLEEREHARARGAAVLGEVRGYGQSGDAFHITQPSEAGTGASLAMERALREGEVEDVSDVGHVNCHATSTPLGDAVELRAVARTFRGHSGRLDLAAPKGAIGHLLGAAGAVEAVFTVMALREGRVPATLNLEDPDPGFKAPSFLHLVRGTSCAVPGLRLALSNSFGFGGTNCSLLLAAPDSR